MRAGAFSPKGNLNQVNMQKGRGIEAQELQFYSYLLAASSLMLMAVLVVGAAEYAGVQRILSSSTTTTTAAHLKYTMSRNSSSFITCE